MAASEATQCARRAGERISGEVTLWPGVTAGPGRRGEFSFRVAGREIGHLHGDRAAHFTFPTTLWAALMEQHRVEPHPVFPNAQGPAARRIRNDDDVADVIRLMRLNYDRLTGRNAPPNATRPGADQ